MVPTYDTTLSIDAVISRIGFGRFQWKLLWICGFGWAADGMEVLLISFIIPAVAKEWALSKSQIGWLGTAIFLGMMAGAWFWGRISDRVGRKFGFIGTVAIDSGFGLLSAFAPSFLWLLILRVFTGFGVGGTLPVDYSIFSEYLPTKNRGRYLVYLEAFWAVGALAAAGLAWLIVPRMGWRWLLAVSALPGIIIIFVRRYIPESPRYLLVQGKNKEALEVLRKVAIENGVSLDDVSGLTKVETRQSEAKDLWRPAIRKTTFLLWSIWFFISFGYYGIFTWLPNYLRSGGMQLLPVYQNSFILALAQLPGYFSAAYFVERIGRRKTLTIYLLASALFTFLFAAATNLTWVIALGIWMSFFTLGAWGVIYAYTPEAYPTVLRATGMGAASGMTRIAGVLAPIMGGLLLGSGMGFPLAIFSAAYLIAGISAWLLPKETRAVPMDDTL